MGSLLDMRSFTKIAFGVAAALFVGYCIYFDFERIHAPDYKKKVRERRQRIQDHEQKKRVYLEQIQKGFAWLEVGNDEMAVEHLATAVLIAQKQIELLHHLEENLPDDIFELLVQKLHDLIKEFDAKEDEGRNEVNDDDNATEDDEAGWGGEDDEDGDEDDHSYESEEGTDGGEDNENDVVDEDDDSEESEDVGYEEGGGKGDVKGEKDEGKNDGNYNYYYYQ